MARLMFLRWGNSRLGVTRRNRHSAIPPRKVLSVIDDERGNLWIRKCG